MNITNTTMNLGVVTINNTHYMAILHYKDENGADCPVPDHVRKASNVALKLFEDVLEQYSNQGAVTRVDEAGFFNRESRIAPHTSEAWETFVRHLEYPNVPGATLGLGGVEIGDKLYMTLLHYRDEQGVSQRISNGVDSHKAHERFQQIVEDVNDDVTYVDNKGIHMKGRRIVPVPSRAWNSFVQYLLQPELAEEMLDEDDEEVSIETINPKIEFIDVSLLKDIDISQFAKALVAKIQSSKNSENHFAELTKQEKLFLQYGTPLNFPHLLKGEFNLKELNRLSLL
ncbi:MAG: hypothetical protein KBA81_04655 [Rhabdochlamydiaceae bacterium]|nr:hypothetical protein [Rhabdochlamydiaceae bacterium]